MINTSLLKLSYKRISVSLQKLSNNNIITKPFQQPANIWDNHGCHHLRCPRSSFWFKRSNPQGCASNGGRGANKAVENYNSEWVHTWLSWTCSDEHVMGYVNVHNKSKRKKKHFSIPSYLAPHVVCRTHCVLVYIL